MRNVPTTKKESMYFGMMMCGGMVLVMTMYNMLINDVIGHITLAEGILNLVITFVFAMAVETFFVGPVAKKVAFSLPFDKSKQLKDPLNVHGYRNGAFHVCIWINYDVTYERSARRAASFKLCIDRYQKLYRGIPASAFYYGTFSSLIVYEICEKESGSGLSQNPKNAYFLRVLLCKAVR